MGCCWEKITAPKSDDKFPNGPTSLLEANKNTIKSKKPASSMQVLTHNMPNYEENSNKKSIQTHRGSDIKRDGQQSSNESNETIPLKPLWRKYASPILPQVQVLSPVGEDEKLIEDTLSSSVEKDISTYTNTTQSLERDGNGGNDT